MTNTIALALAIFITGAVAIDVWYFGTDHVIYLSRKFAQLIEWLAFWW